MRYTVLLTGSTGNLGAYILDELLKHPEIEQVICLNRSKDAERRQRLAHEDRGLGQHYFNESKVRFVQAQFDDEFLGLDSKQYEDFAARTDIVVHNAWPVDFNRNFQSFKPSIDGVDHIIRFCQARRQSENQTKKLLFISSIGATSNWGAAAPSSRSSVPEEIIKDWRVARTGYGQSKLVSERLICHAASVNALSAAIVRVGQLGGPVQHGSHGKWPEQEWIPSIIKSSMMLKALPSTLGPTEIVDWVPSDIAARVIVEIVRSFVKGEFLAAKSGARRKKAEVFFFHVVNPQQAQWSNLVPTIQQRLGASVDTVSFVEWVELLKDSVESAEGFRGVNEGLNPAGKLIDFFDNLQDRAIRFPYARVAQLETIETARVSKALADMDAVNKEWIELWMQQWGWGDEEGLDSFEEKGVGNM